MIVLKAAIDRHINRAVGLPTGQRHEFSRADGVIQIVGGLVVDPDANDGEVGFDIDQASEKLDLSRIETVALPQVIAAE